MFDTTRSFQPNFELIKSDYKIYACLINKFRKKSTLSASVAAAQQQIISVDDQQQQTDYEIDDIIESYSNSKLDSCLDELINLIVKDLILTWLVDLIWDKEKCEKLIK